MERIDSTSNQRIKNWAKLLQKKERDKTGLFLAEGDHLIEEALKAGIVDVILSEHPEQYRFDHVIEAPSHVIQKLCSSRSGTASVAVCRMEEPSVLQTDRVLILDGIQDPGNLGTLIRTARSFGFDAVVTSETSCDLYNEKVLRSTQGAVFQIPVVRRNLSDYVSSLQKQDVYVIATTLAEAVPMKEMNVSDKMAVILGNEGNGVSLELQKQADQRVRIEMSGFESLNVAVAGGILMYQLQKQVKI